MHARAHPSTHTHTLNTETAPATSKLPAISRKSISPVACNFTRRDFSLNASSLFLLHPRSSSSPSSQLNKLHHGARSLSLSAPVLNLSTRILSREECRTRHLFSASVNAANYRQTENRVSLHRYTRRTFSTPSFFRSSFRFSVDIFPIFPPLLWISVRYAGRGDDEVHDRGETVKSISTEGMSDEEGRGGWIRFERNRFPPRRSFFSARLVRATGKAKLEGDKATGRTFGRRHDWVCIFLHPSCNGGTNFPGLRTGRGARLRGRNSMEDFEECSSFKGWG